MRSRVMTAIMAWEKQGMVCMCARVCVWVNPDRSGISTESAMSSPAQTSPEPRPGRGNVIAGAVRAVTESLSVAVHM